jgi:hypothetical protein
MQNLRRARRTSQREARRRCSRLIDRARADNQRGMKNSRLKRGHRGSIVIGALALNLGACNVASADIGTCPTGAEQDVAAGKKLVESCNSCHSFNTESLDSNNATTIWDSIDSGSMPPGGSFSTSEIEQARSFLACAVDPGGGGDSGGASADGGNP